MMTENENWREDSGNEYTGTNREGNQYNNREGRYNRPSYNNREGRPYRPRINAEGGERQPRNYGSSERPFRPRYNNNGNSEGYRPRYNNEEYGSSERPFRPRYNNNSEGYRPRHNSEDGEQTYGSSERPFRPRFNGNNGRGGYNNNKRNSRPRTADYNPHAKYSKKKQIEYKEQFIDPNEPIRLNKYLANAGVCSRREADEYIQAGVVSVNGEVVTELGTKIKRGDEVKFHDQTISIERKIYVLLNKPKDTVTTADDPQARRTVLDLVKGACEERIYPVGRLDRNTTGVLLLTNDGDLASKLTHPSYLKKKIYHVHLDKNLTQADMEKIAAGLELEDGEIQVDAISYTDEAKKSDVGVEIHSGKNRIVRRIFESLGYKVVKLDRVYFAGLTKKGLRRGDWRFLNEHEVNYLRMGSFE
jgi:23S rRNA pseudouridine2605 synthase